jgi:hypothetical protein
MKKEKAKKEAAEKKLKAEEAEKKAIALKVKKELAADMKKEIEKLEKI